MFRESFLGVQLGNLLGYLSFEDEVHLRDCCRWLRALLNNYRRRQAFFGLPVLCDYDKASFSPFVDTQGRFPADTSTSQKLDIAVRDILSSHPFSEEYASSLFIKYIQALDGWGVFAGKTIPCGSRLFAYNGEVLRSTELQRRREIYDSLSINFVLEVHEHSLHTETVYRLNFDATRMGGIARFVNHSCRPNLELQVARHGSLFGIPVFLSTRAIHKGEQLTFDYGDYQHGRNICYQDNNQSSSNKEEEESLRRQKRCLCGEIGCRKYLPSSLL